MKNNKGLIIKKLYKKFLLTSIKREKEIYTKTLDKKFVYIEIKKFISSLVFDPGKTIKDWIKTTFIFSLKSIYTTTKQKFSFSKNKIWPTKILKQIWKQMKCFIYD